MTPGSRELLQKPHLPLSLHSSLPDGANPAYCGLRALALRNQVSRQHRARTADSALTVNCNRLALSKPPVNEADELLGLVHGGRAAIGHRQTFEGNTSRFVN